MKKILFLLFICTVFLTGCNNYHEIETMGIASSMLIDYDDQYKVTVEVTQSEEESGTTKSTIYTGEGETISKAIKDATFGTEKELSYNHLNALILTKNVNLEETILFFLRDPDINNTFYITLTDTTDIYKDEENDLGKTIYQILFRTGAKSFFELSKIFFNERYDFTLPILNEELFIENIMPYDHLEAKSPLGLEKIDSFKILTNHGDTYLKSSCNKDFFVIKTEQVKTKYKIDKKIKINIELEATILEYNCDFDLTKTTDIMKLEKLAKNQMKKNIESFLSTIKENNTDILGLNQLIYNRYHNLKYKWTDFDYEVDVSIHINKKGLMLK